MAMGPGPLTNGTIGMPMAPVERSRGHPDGFLVHLEI
jgi:hypothetical protein